PAGGLDRGDRVGRVGQVEGHHVRAEPGERPADLRSDRARSAGDDGDLTLKAHHSADLTAHHSVGLLSKLRLLTSVNSSRPTCPCWRPTPERFTPPTSSSE